MNPQRLAADELAFRIGRAADKFAIPAVAANQLRAAIGALLRKRLVRLAGNTGSLHQAPRGFAIGIALAGQKNSESSALDGHLLAAIVAILDLRFSAGFFGEFGGKVLNEIAIRIARAAQKEPVTADTLEPLALPALLALLARRNAGLVREHLFVGFIEVHDKFLPELPDRVAPGKLALFDLVELLFEARREGHIENVLEAFY